MNTARFGTSQTTDPGTLARALHEAYRRAKSRYQKMSKSHARAKLERDINPTSRARLGDLEGEKLAGTVAGGETQPTMPSSCSSLSSCCL